MRSADAALSAPIAPTNATVLSAFAGIPYNEYAGSYPVSAVQSAFQSYSATPRNSFFYHNLEKPNKGGIGQRGEKVNLSHVYKVIRFYSFWKTCTSFHRIVTMIEKITDDDIANLQNSTPNLAFPGTSTLDSINEISSFSKSFIENSDSSIEGAENKSILPFKKRLFVQYLWRNAKIQEKARVQKEFDPHRQRLLKFVTDTTERKRVSITLFTKNK